MDMDMDGHDAATAMPDDAHPDDGMGDDHEAEAPGDAHDEPVALEPKPREAVLGAFAAVNMLVLIAAAFTRRRDRVKAATKSGSTVSSRKDASR
jgi:hypothetical protein